MSAPAAREQRGGHHPGDGGSRSRWGVLGTLALMLLLVPPPAAAQAGRVGGWTTGLTHNVGAGSSRLLLFSVGCESGTDVGVSAVTYGGQALTRIAGSVAGTTVFARVELWQLDEAGIAGATGNTFVVTWGAGSPSDPMYAAATYQGVDQTDPVADASASFTDSVTPNPLTATVNVFQSGMVVASALSGNDGTYSWGGGWTAGPNQSSGGTTSMGVADNPVAADGSDTASATHTGPNLQALVAVSLFGVGSAPAGSVCPSLTVRQGTGTFTVIAEQSFEMLFNEDVGGGIEEFYDLAEDPTLDLAGAATGVAALFSEGIQEDPSGTWYDVAANDFASKLDLLEVTPSRVRLRQEAFYEDAGSGNILAGPKLSGDYSIYPSGRMALRWNRKTTSTAAYLSNDMDLNVHWRSSGPLNGWAAYSESGLLLGPNSGLDDFLLAQSQGAGLTTDVLQITYRDWSGGPAYVAAADATDVWLDAAAEWENLLWAERTGTTIPAGRSEIWDSLTYFKPTSFVDNTDPAVTGRRDDYRGPDDLAPIVGSGWFDAGENTALATNDYFNEAEAVYALDFEPGSGLTFDINGGATNPDRYCPAFKIRQWRTTADPTTVSLEGAPLANDSDYRADVKPMSRGQFGTVAWHSTMQDAAAVTSPDVGAPGTVVGADFAADRFGVGNGMRFDADGEYVSVPAAGHFDPSQGSMEFWYQPTYDYGASFGDLTDDFAFFGYWNNTNNYFYAFCEPYQGGVGDNDGINFDVNAGGVLYQANVGAGPSYPVWWRANEWVHLRFAWDVNTSRLEVYINGVLAASGAYASAPSAPNNDILYIGERSRNLARINNPEGIIDELRIYSTVDDPTRLAYGGLTSSSDEYLVDGTRDFDLSLTGVDTNGRGRYAYFGADSKFRGLNVVLQTAGAGVADDALNWEYWDGTAWASLRTAGVGSFGFTDETASLKSSGTVYWTSDPTSWSLYSVNGDVDLYYVRAHLPSGSSYTTLPRESAIKTDILLFQYCGDITADAQTLEFGPSVAAAVELTSFAARGEDGAVELSWETGSEMDNLGFQLYRSLFDAGPYERVTASLIPGLGSSPEGARYRYRDVGLSNGVTFFYQLEDVETTGRTERHGPVSATPQAGRVSPPVSGRPGSGGSTGDAVRSPSDPTVAWVTYGDPEATSLRVVERGHHHVMVELQTGGFYAYPDSEGGVWLSIPGFADAAEPGAPALPVKRTWLEAVAGRRVHRAQVTGRDVVAFSGLRPAVAGEPELWQGSDGTLAAGLRRRPSGAAFRAAGLYPEEAARILGTAFQGEEKKAHLELSPLRWDRNAGQLLLARRLRVRVVFAGRAEGERALGGSRGRSERANKTRVSEGVVVRLSAQERGLYGVSFASLLGVRGRGVSTSDLRLSRQGEAVAFHVEPVGKRFGPGSVLYFVSAGASLNAHGQEAVYELSLEGGGVRMPVQSAAPSGRAIPYYWARGQWELDRFYQPSLFQSPERWFWDFILSPRVKGYTFGVSALAVSSEPSRLEVWLQGASDHESAPDHHVRLSLNGHPVGEASWDGKSPYKLDREVWPGILHEGENRLEIQNVGDTGAAYSRVFLDRFALRHPRRLLAAGGVLEGGFSQGGSAEVQGVGPGSSIVDTSGGVVRWLTDAVPTASGVSFRAEAGRRYLVASPESILRPELRPADPSTLRSARNRADYLVLGPREFLPAAEPLLESRRRQGLEPMGVAIEEVYEAFGHGEAHPEAVRDFLSHAYHHWETSPRYVLLLGDATYDFKDHRGTGNANRVPPYVVKDAYLWTVSDPAYASVNGDDLLPDLALGRLPAQSLEQAYALVQKVLDWETAGFDLSGPAVLVADNTDRAGNFEGDAERLASTLLSDREVDRIYLSRLRGATRPTIIDAFDRGASLMSYLGHGGTAVWASENVFNNWDVPNLAPQAQQPLLLTMNCLNGYFHSPSVDSLGEALVTAEGKGAIAAFSPSSLSMHGPASLYHEALVRELSSGRHARLGDAILAAQVAYAESGACPDLLRIYQLLGDPALPIR